MHPGEQFLKLPAQAQEQTKLAVLGLAMRLLCMRNGGEIELSADELRMCHEKDVILQIDDTPEKLRFYIKEKGKGSENDPATKDE